MSKSLSQYVNYTIGQYILNNDDIKGMIWKKYFDSFKCLRKSFNLDDTYSKTNYRNLFTYIIHHNNHFFYMRKIVRPLSQEQCAMMRDFTRPIFKIFTVFENAPTSSDYYGFECHYRKLGVPFDKLVYQNKLF